MVLGVRRRRLRDRPAACDLCRVAVSHACHAASFLLTIHEVSGRPAPGGLGVAVDVAVLALSDERLCVLLVKLRRAPFEGRWGLPGGLIGARETVEDAATRELREKTGLHDAFLEQVRCFSAPDRDPSGRCVSICFLGLVPAEQAQLSATGKYAGITFQPVDDLPPLPFDHAAMVEAAVARLRGLLETTNVAYSLMPPEFTLGALQRTHEAALGRALDTRNFRKRLEDHEVVVPTGAMSRGGAHRPARLYRFKERKLHMIGRGLA